MWTLHPDIAHFNKGEADPERPGTTYFTAPRECPRAARTREVGDFLFVEFVYERGVNYHPVDFTKGCIYHYEGLTKRVYMKMGGLPELRELFTAMEKTYPRSRGNHRFILNFIASLH